MPCYAVQMIGCKSVCYFYDILDVLFVGCLSSMGRLHVIALLLLWITSVISTDQAVKHEDYTHEPALVRNCIEKQCHCGTEPRICDQDGGDATCVNCPPGSFQPNTISTKEIVSGRQCKPHETCSRGW